jgi:hypothetical protein
MNMKTDFQAMAVNLITSVFGDIAQIVTIRHPIYNNYDEETGALISAYEDYIVKAIVGPWTDDNLSAATSDRIRSDDLSVLLAKTQLVINPEMDVDTLITADGTEWSILYTSVDEAEATLTLRISKGIE